MTCVSSCHSKLLILHMHLFVSGFVYCAPNESHLGTFFDENSSIMQFPPPEI